MSKKVNFIVSCIGFISLIAIMVFGYNYLTDTNNNNINNQDNQKIEGGNVMKITSENFEQEVLESDKPVIVDFYAVWCRTM